MLKCKLLISQTYRAEATSIKKAKIDVATQLKRCLDKFRIKANKITKSLEYYSNLEKKMSSDENCSNKLSKTKRRRRNKKLRNQTTFWNPCCVLNDIRPNAKYKKVIANQKEGENEIDSGMYPKNFLVTLVVDGQTFLGFGSSYSIARQHAAKNALEFIFNKSEN